MAVPGPASRGSAPTADGASDHRFQAMGTDVHVRIVGGPPGLALQAQRAVEQREARWSRFLAHSELSRLNAARGGRPVIVSPDTFALIAAAVEACRLTGGTFDPTVLTSLLAAGYDRPLTQLTPPDPACVRSPAPADAGHIPAAPGVAGIELHPATCAVVLPPGVGLDLGGIAKGATADAVSGELLAGGADGCCVNVGGDLRVRGTAPDGEGWVIGLDCPGAAEPAALRVRVADGAVCTSTVLARRWAGPRGGTEHHLRHPATGAALTSGLRSVTVVAASATQAEVLTKAAFVAGVHGAAAVIRGHGATGVLVADGGGVVPLPGLDPFLVR